MMHTRTHPHTDRKIFIQRWCPPKNGKFFNNVPNMGAPHFFHVLCHLENFFPREKLIIFHRQEVPFPPPLRGEFCQNIHFQSFPKLTGSLAGKWTGQGIEADVLTNKFLVIHGLILLLKVQCYTGTETLTFKRGLPQVPRSMSHFVSQSVCQSVIQLVRLCVSVFFVQATKQINA